MVFMVNVVVHSSCQGVMFTFGFIVKCSPRRMAGWVVSHRGIFVLAVLVLFWC